MIQYLLYMSLDVLFYVVIMLLWIKFELCTEEGSNRLSHYVRVMGRLRGIDPPFQGT